eukprot:gnl/Hemi2/6876_TR2342_c0_g1_i1.p1 gnl/Hemi2/6876_TR2342_c0_g1~~gnl/Hemi2/6876_TR2342_c0_g1_i1.p1  ORF type:complete len:187 (-),score=30.10 gnl/Hemi2/6876_TR2342_c0_g1_i1:57-617(-)
MQQMRQLLGPLLLLMAVTAVVALPHFDGDNLAARSHRIGAARPRSSTKADLLRAMGSLNQCQCPGARICKGIASAVAKVYLPYLKGIGAFEPNNDPATFKTAEYFDLVPQMQDYCRSEVVNGCPNCIPQCLALLTLPWAVDHATIVQRTCDMYCPNGGDCVRYRPDEPTRRVTGANNVTSNAASKK